MPNFTVRVELHYASESDYTALHTAMEQRGFSRSIKSVDGGIYQLPTAEYVLSGNFSRDQVCNMARQAATSTRKENAVLVTESAGWTFDGLTQRSR